MNNTVAWVAIAISVVSGAVAFASYWTGREKLRLDLYDRRLQVYKQAVELRREVLLWRPTERERDLGVQPESINHLFNKFEESLLESHFLFGEESGVTALLSKMGSDAAKIVNYRMHPSISDMNQEMRQKADMRHDHRVYRLTNALTSLQESVAPFLNFHSYSAFPTVFKDEIDEES